MTGPRFGRRRMHAQVLEAPSETPSAGEVAVYLVALLDRTFTESVGISAASTTERGTTLHAAGPAGLSVGDVVTIDRRDNRWWINEEVDEAVALVQPYMVVWYSDSGTETVVVLDSEGSVLRTYTDTGGDTIVGRPAIGKDRETTIRWRRGVDFDLDVYTADGTLKWSATSDFGTGLLTDGTAWEPSGNVLAGALANAFSDSALAASDGTVLGSFGDGIYTDHSGVVAEPNGTSYILRSDPQAPRQSLVTRYSGALAAKLAIKGAGSETARVLLVGPTGYVYYGVNTVGINRMDANLTTITTGPTFASVFGTPTGGNFVVLPGESLVFGSGFTLRRYIGFSASPFTLWSKSGYNNPLYDRLAGKLYARRTADNKIVRLDPNDGSEIGEFFTIPAVPGAFRSADVFPGRSAAYTANL